MKTSSLRPVLLLLALGSILPLAASAATRSELPGGILPVSRVEARVRANGDFVAPGDSRIYVQLRLGSPTRVLPDGSWLYQRYRAATRDGREIEGNLIVRYENSHVAALALADQATVTALIEKRLVPSSPQFAANQR